MNVIKRASKSRERILLDHPWWSHLLLSLEVVESNSYPRAATDMRKIFINPKFVDSLNDDYLDFVMCHEALHCGLLHCFYDGLDHKRWNRACDYAINPLLISTGLKAPKDCLISDEYEGMSAENIYRILPETLPLGFLAGDVIKADKEITKRERIVWQQSMAAAMHTATQHGVLSSNEQRFIHDALTPPLDWRELLVATVARKNCNEDYTWRIPSRRGNALGLYLPSSHGYTTDKVAIAIDTSGSMPEALLSEAICLIRDAINQTSPKELMIIEADCDVKKVTVIECNQEFSPPNLSGGGGTDFRPAIALAEKHEIKTMVYITDLCGEFPKSSSLDLIFLTHSNNKAPLGVTINMEISK